jgi:hypothetical protein
MTDSVLAHIAALAKASLSDLKAQWRDLFGTEPPGIKRAYLERRIAYRLQELAYGGLSEVTKARLADLAKTADRGSSPRTRMWVQDRPIAGTKLDAPTRIRLAGVMKSTQTQLKAEDWIA